MRTGEELTDVDARFICSRLRRPAAQLDAIHFRLRRLFKGLDDGLDSPNGLGVVDVKVTASGAGFVYAPTVTFTGGWPRVQAQALAVVEDGKVTSVVVTESGSDYQAVPVVHFSGGGGLGARATAYL